MGYNPLTKRFSLFLNQRVNQFFEAIFLDLQHLLQLFPQSPGRKAFLPEPYEVGFGELN